ncbi:uncharacterized protein LOC132754074 [Ruditapes philippinarum]|uniref:uncharacterized protein LOC132754074 n=1 Tax=Ruditapes philippinarum TaxID=129788 RepID=UPI00295AB409|nr:uncharacterized protein LOC132754074 [Ruditapes philippinarum]
MGLLELGLILIFILLSKIPVSNGKQCLKNDDIGWREGNIYSCTDPSKPACCEVFNEFTCCEEPKVKNLREQIQLWGSFIAIALILFIIYLYYNNDAQPLCACNCHIVDACATFFRRMRNVNSRRKHTFNMKDKHYANEAKETSHILPQNKSFHNNTFEKFTIT